MANLDHPTSFEFGPEINVETFRLVIIRALEQAFQTHEALAERGEEMVQKNRFGDTALRVDIEAELAILNTLKELRVPIRVISEEHGVTDIGDPRFLGILDGLDGSNVYKKERGRGRYATMFSIFNSLDPLYSDYISSGILEHSVHKLSAASKNGGAHSERDGIVTPIHSSGRIVLDQTAKIYIDEYWEINRTTFSKKLEDFNVSCIGSSAIYYADVASGAADLALECTRKSNLELAVAYGLIVEAGGVMVDMEGNDLGGKKYFEFGQNERLPVITAATQELASNLINHLKK